MVQMLPLAMWERYLTPCTDIRERRSNFDAHLRTHLPPESRTSYACSKPGCNIRYSRKSDVTRHIREDHDKTRPKRTSKKGSKKTSNLNRTGRASAKARS
ncbi:hypothetical protein C8Q76DRAFT_413496 [Earliella scabrosa]|nr:hypothetical protein C8Q76DRAFT_413496 [Earliella scabrosa]